MTTEQQPTETKGEAVGTWTVEQLREKFALWERMNELSLRALDKWGAEAQIGMLFEEMSEVGKALAKFYWRGGDIEHVREELADLAIVLHQMRLLFDVMGIEAWIVQKLDRLELKLAESGDAVPAEETEPERPQEPAVEGRGEADVAEDEGQANRPQESEGPEVVALAATVRAALARSSIFGAAVQAYPVMIVADAGVLAPETWTNTERLHAIEWAGGERPFPPKPIVAFLAELDRKTAEQKARASEE